MDDRFEYQEPPPTDEPLRPEDPHWSLAFLYLAFRPKVFFKTYALHHIPALVALAAWCLGMFGVIDRFETRMMTSPDSELVKALRGHWGVYWTFVAFAGIVSGAIYFAIGGWWYRTRLKWAGAVEPDPALARRVYLFAAQVLALPTLVISLADTFRFATPGEAYAADKWTDFVPILLVFWSVYVSYRGVRTAFEAVRWKVRLWFFFLPGLFYGVAFSVVMLVFLFGAMAQTPDLDSPTSVERGAFRLEHPGNWNVDKQAVDYDPDDHFSIEPLFADAVMSFWFYDTPMSSQDCVDQTLSNMESSYDIESIEGLEAWGDYPGAGYTGIVVIAGGRYDMLLFCSTERATPFEVMMLCSSDVYAKISSGFDHIEATFRLADESGATACLRFAHRVKTGA